MNEGNVRLADRATTHIILRDKRYFLNLTLTNANVNTIYGTTNLIKGLERENIMHYIMANMERANMVLVPYQ